MQMEKVPKTLEKASLEMWKELITQVGTCTCTCTIYAKHAGKMTKFNIMSILPLLKSHMHILNFSKTNVQGLKNFIQKVWEELK
jgi:hypothetical protein